MARFILSHRRAGKFTKEAKVLSRARLDEAFRLRFKRHVKVISDYALPGKTRRRVLLVEVDAGEIEDLKRGLPADVIVEPEFVHYPQWSYPREIESLLPESALAFGTPQLGEPASAGLLQSEDEPVRGDDSFQAIVKAGGAAVSRANVSITLKHRETNETAWIPISTDKNGRAMTPLGREWEIVRAGVEPAAGYWSQFVRTPPNSIVFSLRPLPKAEGCLGWWHRRCGIDKYNPARGKGIKVGVIDTGVGPHPYLEPDPDHVVLMGSFGQRRDERAEATLDADQHGTHVAGLIAARPTEDTDYAGLAPGCTLYVARITPRRLSANQKEMALAIDVLSRDAGVDLINISFSSSAATEQLLTDAIQDAAERGTLCICAAGNGSSKTITLPARVPASIAVGAIGVDGDESGPLDSFSARNHSDDPDKTGRGSVFLAGFSNFGPLLDCVAPGVGIISTVPVTPGKPDGPRPYMVFDGTSMATPIACGLLAGLLAEREDYQRLPRDRNRAAAAESILRAACIDLGLARNFEGDGLPIA